MKHDITPSKISTYAFTEVIFDGTDEPFDVCVGKFLAKPEHEWVKILAKNIDKRSCLFLFGVNEMKEGMELLIPEDWRDTLSGRYVWREGTIRLATPEEILKLDGITQEDIDKKMDALELKEKSE